AYIGAGLRNARRAAATQVEVATSAGSCAATRGRGSSRTTHPAVVQRGATTATASGEQAHHAQRKYYQDSLHAEVLRTRCVPPVQPCYHPTARTHSSLRAGPTANAAHLRHRRASSDGEIRSPCPVSVRWAYYGDSQMNGYPSPHSRSFQVPILPS